MKMELSWKRMEHRAMTGKTGDELERPKMRKPTAKEATALQPAIRSCMQNITQGLTRLQWCGYTAEKQEETATEQGESVRQLWNLGNGSQVLVQVTKNLQPDGKAGCSYDFRWNYQTEGTLVSYDTSDGIHRIDYLPLNPTKNDLASNRKKGYYVLVETKTPSGYQKAAPKPVIVEETD